MVKLRRIKKLFTLIKRQVMKILIFEMKTVCYNSYLYFGDALGAALTSLGHSVEYFKIDEDALDDLESVEVGTGTEKIKDLQTFGPNNSTELISTISSVVAVSKIIAPILLITSLFIAFIWIFYGGI